MIYRREIDGLRSLAILPVILFHAGFEIFSGGFVGVDIFFVISGYLITSIILKEKHEETFTLTGFYERRARRILPALFFVMLACLPLSWLLLWPSDMQDFAQSLISVSLFVSNFLFWAESGYFETAVELKPLLHTWSLAVEEQFYLFFPIFMMLTWKLNQKKVVTILAVVAMISLALAQWASLNRPDAAFYLLPTRGWELLIGAFLAFYLFNKGDAKAEVIATRKWRQLASSLGLVLIIYAVSVFDKSTPFPGLYALIPTLGTALIILFARPQTFVGTLLSSKLFVGVGLISYSAYLWHQPLFVFARHLVGNPSVPILLCLAVLAFLFAGISWKFVEQPFRNRQSVSKKRLIITAVSFSIFFILIGNYINNKEGLVVSLSDKQKEVLSFKRYDKTSLYKQGECFLSAEQTHHDFSSTCADVMDDIHSNMIWGDSHAAALSSGLRFFQKNTIQYTASGCPPVIDKGFNLRPHCKNINDFVLTRVATTKPLKVFLHANWLRYKRKNIAITLKNTIEKINIASPKTKIYIIGGVPQWEPNLPVVMLQNKITLDKERMIHVPLLNELIAVDQQIQQETKGNKVTFLSVIDSLCKGYECQASVKLKTALQPIVWDEAHLTEAGSLLLAKLLLAKIPYGIEEHLSTPSNATRRPPSQIVH